MKIYTHAKSTLEDEGWSDDDVIDSKTIEEFDEEGTWKPGTVLWFNGTKKGTRRFSQIGVEIEPEDIIDLFNDLVLYLMASDAAREKGRRAAYESAKKGRRTPNQAVVVDEMVHLVELLTLPGSWEATLLHGLVRNPFVKARSVAKAPPSPLQAKTAEESQK